MADGASGVQPPSSLVRIGLPPAAGGAVGPLRPACASCTPSLATPYCRQKSCTRLSAFSLSSDHMPAHFGDIRPCGLTSVISVITSPAQPSEKLPRCIRCQSLAEPLSELYWHIGDTTTRLGSVSPRSVIGENRTLAIASLFGAEIRLSVAISRNAAGSIRRIPRLSAQAGPGVRCGEGKRRRGTESVDARFWLIQTFNGISYGALLFLIGSGLSLIFGVMRVVNLSHGAYFLWGGYIALSVIWATGSWALSLPLAACAVALLGLLMERVFLRPLGFDPLRQVLLTVGFAYLFQQGALDIWGGNNMEINPPDALTHSVVVGGIYLPLYRVFMIATALAIGITIWLVMERTRMGAAVRATVDDAQMGRGGGIDTNRISMFIFALGAFLAALGGVVGGTFLGVYPGLDFEMLPLAFAVVIIGGMGSLGGAAIGALAVGLADNFGKALFPELAYFTLYAPMVLILAIKPSGLFGRE